MKAYLEIIHTTLQLTVTVTRPSIVMFVLFYFADATAIIKHRANSLVCSSLDNLCGCLSSARNVIQHVHLACPSNTPVI